MPFREYTPISISALNNNLDANLNAVLISVFANVVSANIMQTPILEPKASTNTYLEMRGGYWPYVHPRLRCYSNDNGGFPSRFVIAVPDSAKTSYLDVMQVDGNTDTPFINFLSRRLANVGAPTTAGDAIPYQAWATWTATLTWGGTQPTGVSQLCRYTQIGKTVFYVTYVAATDSKATTSLLISLPVSRGSSFLYAIPLNGLEGAGNSGTTYSNPLAYLDSASRVAFLAWVTPINGQPVSVWSVGFYEVD